VIIFYHADVLTGDSSQIVAIARYISTLPKQDRDRFKIEKVIYTSDSLTPSQRLHIREVLGDI
jgi:phenylacetate-coenzyme A ligase PaaK-like adenylate-forming protein